MNLIQNEAESSPETRAAHDFSAMTVDERFDELQASRQETDGLFQLISNDDLFARPLPQRHRLIFYVGHLEAFDWNHLGRFGLGEPSFQPTLDHLFERGIDPEPGQLPADQPEDWPTLAETREYVESTRQRLDSLWREGSADLQQRIVEHRWMHAETLAYLLHNLPHERKRKPSATAALPEVPGEVPQQFIPIPEGTATLGRQRDSGFGWDNEFVETKITVPSFSVSQYKVTNGDYLDFVKTGQEAPHFWECLRGDWYYRGMFDFQPLPLDAPVYVTQHQATAYARWKGKALPSEAQFHRAAYGTPEGSEQEYPWGTAPPNPAVHGNFGFTHWDPVSVLSHDNGQSAFGVAQTVGNGWEWTSTPFGPLPGFTPMANYAGYSADFFDNKHFVMKGGSPRTASALSRRSLRNWFRPDYPYVYATFRLVEN